MEQNCQIAFWIGIIVIAGSTMSITMPLIVHGFPSQYLVLFLSSFEFVLFFGVFLLGAFCHYLLEARKTYQRVPDNESDVPAEGYSRLAVNDETGVPSQLPWNQSTSSQVPLYYSGFHNTLSALFLTYASDPAKTPIELQSIISSMVIIPSFCMTKWYLKKKVNYNLWFLLPSVFFLLGGMILGVAPVFKNSNDTESVGMVWLWIILYMFGTIFRAAANIMQEKYFMETKKFSVFNKIWVVFVSRMVQFVLVIFFFWMDPIMRNQSFHVSWQQFLDSWASGFADQTTGSLFQLFIFSYLVLFFASLSLNAISTNFNMVASMIITPTTMLFFQIFESLNPGMKFSWGVTLGSLFCNLISTGLWIAAEKF